mmetsp:Transcript_14510/g.31432  ORF Transcript_14510/g.31432 Transcript_14510/m.31432 type:complete len:293 (-) Transcript_14510:559-1437(-)
MATSARQAALIRWLAIRAKPGNDRCAECDSSDTSWVVLDYGVLVCIQCAGAHRALGSHISKVRSVELDEFTETEFDWVEAMGNLKSNAVWEAAVPPCMRRPLVDSADTIRHRWLRVKYGEHQFVAGNAIQRTLPHQNLNGWLFKQGSLLPTWRRRFFQLKDGEMRYYMDDSCSADKLRGTVVLAGASVAPNESDPCSFDLRHAQPGRKPLLARAGSLCEAEEWLWSLYHCTYAATLVADSAPVPVPATASGKPSSSVVLRSLPTSLIRRSPRTQDQQPARSLLLQNSRACRC